MNNLTSTGAWSSHLVIVLGITIAASASELLLWLVITGQSVSKLLLGMVTLIGLLQLLIPSHWMKSSLNKYGFTSLSLPG